MDMVISYIKDYGFDIDHIILEKTKGLYCKNSVSIIEFILDCTDGNLETLYARIA